MPIAPEPFFLPAATGARFCIHYAPATTLRGAILYVHPFAEEMNKSRRMAALGARALAAHGYAVLQIDLLGCGDSSGDLADASWNAWLDDVALGRRWLQQRHGVAADLWGLRLGATLAAQAVAQLDCHPDLLLWQPVVSGSQHLTQFLRLKLAATAIGGNGTRVDTKALRESLARGEAIEVAGYRLPAPVALPMDEARLTLPGGYAGRVRWLEVGPGEEVTLAPASRQAIAALEAQGAQVDAACVSGLPFWQTTEIAEVGVLVDATVAQLNSHAHI